MNQIEVSATRAMLSSRTSFLKLAILESDEPDAINALAMELMYEYRPLPVFPATESPYLGSRSLGRPLGPQQHWVTRGPTPADQPRHCLMNCVAHRSRKRAVIKKPMPPNARSEASVRALGRGLRIL
jgi:hypothetical protein